MYVRVCIFVMRVRVCVRVCMRVCVHARVHTLAFTALEGCRVCV